jgi:outer membrane protein OmpA-like peptidoglycan-associated protein/flagellar hook assembly protein FlgD
MKKGIWGLGMMAVLVAALVGCQTTTPGTRENTIQTEQTGLAPGGAAQHATIDFSLFTAKPDSIKTWKVEMVMAGHSQKSWGGDAKSLPTTITWDGRGDAGSLAPEGVYSARLTTGDGSPNAAITWSQSFILDISPPTGSLTFDPRQLAPSDSGAVAPMTVSIAGKSATARMDSWSIDIFDGDGRSIRSFDGQWPNTSIQWDGKSSAGNWIAPSRTYDARAVLRDEFGNTALVSTKIAVSNLPSRPDQPTVPSFSIAPATGGFSPNGDGIMDTIALALTYGAQKSASSWKVELLRSDNQVQKTFKGDGINLPATLVWDGKSDTGTLASEGTYTARLSVEYGSMFKPGSTVSSPFVLDTTPPAGSIWLSDALYSPMEASPNITLNVNARSTLARIDSWKMEIYDPEDHLFRGFSSSWPTQSVVWDGRGFRGDLVQSAEDYAVIVRVRDEFGNVGVLQSVVPVDILVEKIPTGFRILSSRIFFKAYTADYKDVKPALADQNTKRLADMAAKLRKFPDYNIRLVGHAVMINWDNAKLGTIEQRDVLLPLSASRAEAVKSAMVDLGLQPRMFTTAGVGATDQLVPDSDFADRWRNRRVAFFIEK